MSSQGRRDRETLLELAPHVDWRFLLPDPRLGTVVYIGRRKPDLIAACAAFAERLTFADGTGGSEEETGDVADVAVAADPRLTELRRAAALLPAGGRLYVEFSGWSPAGIVHARRAWLSRRGVHTVERLGFDCIRAYWHWPSFSKCTEIVPLDEPQALRTWLSRRGTGSAGAVKARAARIALSLGVHTLLAPATSLVARRVEGGRA